MPTASAWVNPILRHADGRAPRISSGWGSPRAATEATTAHSHAGADIMYRRPSAVPSSVYDVDRGSANYELPRGSPVVAAGTGVVTLVGTTKLGTHVIIAHAGTGLITFYQHLEKAYVRKGQVVGTGQKIGIAGHGEIGSIRHLHFEIRKWNGDRFVAFDPEATIEGWPVLSRPADGSIAPGDTRGGPLGSGRGPVGAGLWVGAALVAGILLMSR